MKKKKKSDKKLPARSNGKHPGGRPIETLESVIEEGKLPPEWEEIIILKSLEGYSDAEIRRELLISGGSNVKSIKEIWYKLKAREAEFQEAISIGKVLQEAWWTEQCRTSLNDKFFQTFAWVMNMKNRFGWRDKTEFDGTLKDEGWEKYKDLKLDEIRERIASLFGPKFTGAPKVIEALGTAQEDSPA